MLQTKTTPNAIKSIRNNQLLLASSIYQSTGSSTTLYQNDKVNFVKAIEMTIASFDSVMRKCWQNWILEIWYWKNIFRRIKHFGIPIIMSLFSILYLFCVCVIYHSVQLKKQPFRDFRGKYTTHWNLPDRTGLQRIIR